MVNIPQCRNQALVILEPVILPSAHLLTYRVPCKPFDEIRVGRPIHHLGQRNNVQMRVAGKVDADAADRRLRVGPTNTSDNLALSVFVIHPENPVGHGRIKSVKKILASLERLHAEH